MDAIFGDMSGLAKFGLAFVVVLALLGAAGYVVRRFGGTGLAIPTSRGVRQPRLSVIEAANVDARRRLVLVRRDNTEHLLLIGGPTDIVIEPNVARTAAPATAREAKASPALETLPLPRQPLPIEAAVWPQSEPVYAELPPAPPPPPRPVREVVRPPPVPAERQRLESFEEEITAPPLFAMPPAEPTFQAPSPSPPPYEPVFQIPPEPEPKRMPAAPPLPSRPQSEESNLAEMAQRLEAALRRPLKPVEPVPSPASRFTSAPAPVTVATPVAAPAVRPAPPRSLTPPPAPPPAVQKEPMPELKVVPADSFTRPSAAFTSIEEEMASLLGRSTGKT